MLNLCELFGVEEYEEFEIITKAVKNGQVCRISCNTLMIKTPENWVRSELRLNDIISAEIKKLPYKPKLGHKYYTIMPSSTIGIARYVYRNDRIDKTIESGVGFYRTEQDALEELKRLYPNHLALKE